MNEELEQGVVIDNCVATKGEMLIPSIAYLDSFSLLEEKIIDTTLEMNIDYVHGRSTILSHVEHLYRFIFVLRAQRDVGEHHQLRLKITIIDFLVPRLAAT